MKILMFGWEFPPYNSGGLGVACYGLTKALAAQHNQVIFVLPREVDISAPFLKLIFADSNIKMRSVDSLLTPYITSEVYGNSRTNKGSKLYGRNLFEEVERYATLARKIALEEDFDIIHAHDWLSFGAGIEAKKASGKPLVVHVHSTEFDRGGGNSVNQWVYNIEKEGMEQADSIIAVSNFTKNIIVEKYGIDPAKVEVIWNGIEGEAYKDSGNYQNNLVKFKQAGCKMVLFVGRLTLQKGPDYFLLAAKKVLEFNPNVMFVIVGSGDLENQIIQQAVSLGISDKVVFAGFLRGEELNMLYQAADLFVMSSVSEPFGITALESLANGTPVIVSKQSGVSEAISHVLKVDFWDIDEMANQILAVLENGSLQTTLSQNGGKEISKLNWHEAAGKCIDLYKKILGSIRR